MLKFEKTDVFNFENAIRGMRNPMNSWDRMDSEFGEALDDMVIGPNDMDLMQRLISGGPVHSKYLRQIFVSVDITGPLYWWKEFDTYKVGTTSNSCSTMHKIHAKEFDLDDFSYEHLSKSQMDSTELVDTDGNDTNYFVTPKGLLKITIGLLNNYRKRYLETKDKKYWWQMIQLLPSSYNQKRTVTMTYENLRNMYRWRKNHKLDEWSVDFMEWIDSLPYADELIKYQ